ncbi:hypothetical protein HBN50_17435 [Halobacteriovorax sp. GB3]|uniref:hypothetical protein n=1 Tax=Halobacteriovorax sp. GB3 TaxID=2719615 RepID=UPI00235FBD95|nr:hypothetical protein [Halobacteriovorax sp. GB3]MDD0854887.1 hypothetical protein [Halobacteriovorax sp. GB3]
MLKKVTALTILAVSFHSYSFGIGSFKTSYLQSLIYRNQTIKSDDSTKSKGKIDPYTYCYGIFLSQKEVWEKEVQKQEGQTQLVQQGGISRPFTLDEILNMEEKHPHLKTNIRGTNRLKDTYSILGKPRFPHARTTCSDFFEEEVQVKQIDGKLCREVRFTTPEDPSMIYYQVYCANDYSLYIKFE